MSKINVRKRGTYYEYRVEIARVDNIRKWMSKSGFRTKQEALEAGAQAYNEYINAGVPFKQCNMSYSDYLSYWLENYCKNNLKYNTIQTYTIIINKYLKNSIGKYKLSTITSVALNSFITDLVNKYNHSRTYYKNILKVIKGSFRDACNLYGFIKYNPALTLRLPKIDQLDNDIKHLYTQEEIDLIINRFKDDSTFIASFLTSCYTGMRTGEVFALTWDDIDLDNGIINITHSVYDKPKDYDGRWYLGSTKTISGTRTIYISKTLLTALKNFKQRQDKLKEIFGKDYKYYHLENIHNNCGKIIDRRIVLNKENEEVINLVFTRDDGTYVGTDITKYPFKIIHNELGIKKCRFYDLRGSYATKVLNNGIDIKDVANLLGHRNIETTENYYITSLEDNRKNAVELFDSNNHSEVIENAIKFQIQEGNTI
jgi:integrase